MNGQENEIMVLAKQAGLHFHDFVWTSPTDTCMYPEGVYQEALEAFAKLVAAKEREACLKICEAQASTNYWEGADVCAESIRARA